MRRNWINDLLTGCRQISSELCELQNSECSNQYWPHSPQALASYESQLWQEELNSQQHHSYKIAPVDLIDTLFRIANIPAFNTRCNKNINFLHGRTISNRIRILVSDLQRQQDGFCLRCFKSFMPRLANNCPHEEHEKWLYLRAFPLLLRKMTVFDWVNLCLRGMFPTEREFIFCQIIKSLLRFFRKSHEMKSEPLSIFHW